MNKKEAIGWIVFVVGAVILGCGIDVINWVLYFIGLFVLLFGINIINDKTVKIDLGTIKTQEDYDKACKLLQEAGFNEKM